MTDTLTIAALVVAVLAVAVLLYATYTHRALIGVRAELRKSIRVANTWFDTAGHRQREIERLRHDLARTEARLAPFITPRKRDLATGRYMKDAA